jgi:hypothetical protein
MSKWSLDATALATAAAAGQSGTLDVDGVMKKFREVYRRGQFRGPRPELDRTDKEVIAVSLLNRLFKFEGRITLTSKGSSTRSAKASP